MSRQTLGDREGTPLTIAWETVRREFDSDGSLRDIYIQGTSLADWQRLLEWLSHSSYEVAFRFNGHPARLPSTASEVFEAPGTAASMLTVEFAGVRAVCHFFVRHEIEFDIDPREVRGQAELDSLFGFMRQLADTVNKEAVLTPENTVEVVIFRICPGSSKVEWQDFGGWR